MTEEILSAFKDCDGKVVALTNRACYHYAKKLTDEQSDKLLKAIAEKKEINPDHWKVEWEFNGVSLSKQ
jgi:hypothetical protein